MITIEQLLESVELDFEPRWVTKDLFNRVRVWEKEPSKTPQCWTCGGTSKLAGYEYLKLAEFDGKDWTECIYEIRRNQPFSGIETTGKIEKLACYELADEKFNPTGKFEPMCYMELIKKINELVDAVNELKERE